MCSGLLGLVHQSVVPVVGIHLLTYLATTGARDVMQPLCILILNYDIVFIVPRGPTLTEISYTLPEIDFEIMKSEALKIRNHFHFKIYSVKSRKLLHTSRDLNEHFGQISIDFWRFEITEIKFEIRNQLEIKLILKSRTQFQQVSDPSHCTKSL